MRLSEQRSSMLHGVLLIGLFSCAAFYIGSAQIFIELSFSPMIIGIILGMLYANSLRNNLPETWVPGIQFCSKKLLRLGIILYGFRLTFQQVIDFSALLPPVHFPKADDLPSYKGQACGIPAHPFSICSFSASYTSLDTGRFRDLSRPWDS